VPAGGTGISKMPDPPAPPSCIRIARIWSSVGLPEPSTWDYTTPTDRMPVTMIQSFFRIVPPQPREDHRPGATAGPQQNLPMSRSLETDLQRFVAKQKEPAERMHPPGESCSDQRQPGLRDCRILSPCRPCKRNSRQCRLPMPCCRRSLVPHNWMRVRRLQMCLAAGCMWFA
jgi:hypothetical protein